MLVVIIDSATPAITAAIAEITADRVAVRAQRRAVDARAHGELLAPGIHGVLREVGARPRDLGAVVAGVGPGPFTGLRVGLVTAAALADSLGIPTYGVCSLDGIGHLTAGRTLVATDARRKEIYWAIYEHGERRTEPAVDRPADVAAAARDLEVAQAAGEGAERYADMLGLPVLGTPRYPEAAALVAIAAARIRAGAPGERLVPLYLRRPDAVEPAARKPVLRQ